ncbi:THO complex subunit 7 family protein [Sporobolomyces koalae]|uniref:THO complex subunit 7 family protein n=1 Tax=Sporobolomyces koalae TaxID=500713 RepID=UPI003176A41F
MDSEALRVLAEYRAQSDTKLLKKSIKDFYALLNPALSPEQLEASHTTLQITLDQLEYYLSKPTRIRSATVVEIEQYRAQQLEIDQHSLETRTRIEQLSNELVQAKRERSRRIEYDAQTKIITKLPDRAKGTESQTKLEADIQLLKQEEQTYSETWSTRKLAFDSIVESLESMQEAIRDEKAEQERRRALDDAEEEEGTNAPETATSNPSNLTALDPNATPFVPNTTSGTASPDTAQDEEMQDLVEPENVQASLPGKEEGEESVEEGEMDTRS